MKTEDVTKKNSSSRRLNAVVRRLERKWFWKMQWCKRQQVSPAHEYWWGKADSEYNKFIPNA